MTGNIQSDDEYSSDKITLRAYVTALRLAATAELPALTNVRDPGQRVIKELLESGLVSDSRLGIADMVIKLPIALTPAGAHALVEWSEYLRKETWQYKFEGSVIRFMWIIVGAICASLPSWLQ